MKRVFCIILGLTFFSFNLVSEVVVLKSGDVIKGIISAVQEDSIIIKTEYGESVVYKITIEKIYYNEDDYNILSNDNNKTQIKSSEIIEEKNNDKDEYHFNKESNIIKKNKEDPLYIAYKKIDNSGTALFIPGIIGLSIGFGALIGEMPLIVSVSGSSYYSAYNPILLAFVSSILFPSITGMVFFIVSLVVYNSADKYLNKWKQKYNINIGMINSEQLDINFGIKLNL